MTLRFLRLARWSTVPLGGLVAVMALGGACGGGSSSAGSSDSGPGFDGTYDSGSSSGGSGSSSGGSGSGSGSSSGGSGSSGGSSGGAADSGNDAPYEFDGFAHLDGYTEASYCPDDDGDGWTVCGGDCNDHDSLINPCAFDTNDPNDPVGTDGIDNDCDGFVDNLNTCETGLASGFDQTPADYVHAAGISATTRSVRGSSAPSGMAPPSRTASASPSTWETRATSSRGRCPRTRRALRRPRTCT